MAVNVFERVSGKSSLLEAMNTNKSVADAVMGYLNLFLGISVERKYPVDGVRIGTLIWSHDDVFRAPITLSHLATSMPSHPLEVKSSFSRYVGRKANFMAETLRLNPTFEKFFEIMVGQIRNWALTKGVRYEDVDIVDPIVTGKDYVLQFKLQRSQCLVTA